MDGGCLVKQSRCGWTMGRHRWRSSALRCGWCETGPRQVPKMKWAGSRLLCGYRQSDHPRAESLALPAMRSCPTWVRVPDSNRRPGGYERGKMCATVFNITSTCRGGGYMYARTEPRHPKANSKGLYPLHRVLVENHIGRLLGPNEVVHHLDGDKSNNSIENLRLMTLQSHIKEHYPTPPKPLAELECPVCFAKFTLPPRYARLRARRNKSGLVACSRSCGAKL